MIHLTFYRVRPGELDRLQAWLAEAMRRADEVRETYLREGVRHEQAYFLENGDGHVLVYAVECENFNAAAEAFAASDIPIDLEHKAMMAALTDGALELRPALDLQL